MGSTAIDPLIAVARAARPVLNRLVFTGIHTNRFLHRTDRGRIRRPGGVSSTHPALATVTLDRLAPELTTAGFSRARREGNREEWQLAGQGSLALSTATEGATQDHAVVLEYAVLLTRSVLLAADLSVRVTVPATQLALSWIDYRASGHAFTESGDVEDMLEIVACHAGLASEMEVLPEELRALIAHGPGPGTSRSLPAQRGSGRAPAIRQGEHGEAARGGATDQRVLDLNVHTHANILSDNAWRLRLAACARVGRCATPVAGQV